MSNNVTTYKFSPLALTVLAAVCALLLFLFFSGLERMVYRWNSQEEYGYGYLIPVITAFFIWQKNDVLRNIQYNGTWVGVLVVLAGVFLYVLGELSTLFIIVQYAFLLTLYGAILSLTGWKTYRLIWVPLLFLIFMIPLPNFIYQGLSAQLQLISSELGVAFMRLFDISVYLEGNVIDLGVYKLQVVEACSGLRYLFPLAALSFIAAYMFKVAFWKRAVIFLLCVPITIFMNSFRIGVIGLLVNAWGVSQAEGFLHYFEGWVIFMACMVLLFFAMWILSKVGGENRPFYEMFSIDYPEPVPDGAIIVARKIPVTFLASGVLIIAALGFSVTLDERQNIAPDRASFSEFPMKVNTWEGHGGALESIYLDVLKLDDYVIADYVNDAGEYVNFYVAYYASQSKGESAHSPRSCIPGGGWKIENLRQEEITGVTAGGVPLVVNRLIIRKGEYYQLVYYWFQGRGRNITNEYMVKWFLFWDALTRRRTDGALVRLTAYVAPGEDIAEADKRLTLFARDVSGVLDDYIPD